MATQKRQKFECGACHKIFSVFITLTDEQELIYPCPFCRTELVISLEPFRKKVVGVLKSVEVMRGVEKEDEKKQDELTYNLPDVLPAHPRA